MRGCTTGTGSTSFPPLNTLIGSIPRGFGTSLSVGRDVSASDGSTFFEHKPVAVGCVDEAYLSNAHTRVIHRGLHIHEVLVAPGERSPWGAKVKNKEEGRQPGGATGARPAGALSFRVPSAAALRFRTQRNLEWVKWAFSKSLCPIHRSMSFRAIPNFWNQEPNPLGLVCMLDCQLMLQLFH